MGPLDQYIGEYESTDEEYDDYSEDSYDSYDDDDYDHDYDDYF